MGLTPNWHQSAVLLPQRFVSDQDSDELLELFDEVEAAGRHLAVMGHYSHPVELDPAISHEAIRRVRNTGAQIRMQGPLIRHVNDDSEAWVTLWRTGVRLGLIPLHVRRAGYRGTELFRGSARSSL